MGYQTSITDPTPPPKIELRSVSKSDFELMTAFAYIARNGREVEVPTHPNPLALSTDLASVPPLLWGLLPSYGRQLRAALLHDRLCDLVNEHPTASEAYQERHAADDMFLEALRDPGDGSPEDIAKRVGWFRSQLFWTGVSYGRYWKFRKILATLLTLHVLVGVLALDLIFRLPVLIWLAAQLPGSWARQDRVLILIWVIALALSAIWRGDRKIPFIGLLVGPVILPVLLLTFAGQTVLGLPDWLLHRIRPEEQPPGNFGPTVTKFPPPQG
jgi:hypothetical protein